MKIAALLALGFVTFFTLSTKSASAIGRELPPLPTSHFFAADPTGSRDTLAPTRGVVAPTVLAPRLYRVLPTRRSIRSFSPASLRFGLPHARTIPFFLRDYGVYHLQ